MQPHDDLARCRSRHRDPEPRAGLETLQALFVDSRHFGQHRHPFDAGHTQRAHAAASDVRQDRNERAEINLDMPGDDVDERRRRAFVRHMDHPDAGHGLEQFAGQVMRTADARRPVAQLIRVRARQRNQLLRVFGGHRRMHDDDARHLRNVGHVREVLEGIVGEFRIKRDVDRVGHRRHEQRVTVGRRSGRDLGCDIGARAGAVLDYHRLPPCFSDPRADRARQNIRGAARRVADDETDWFGRIILCVRPARNRPAERGQRAKDDG